MIQDEWHEVEGSQDEELSGQYEEDVNAVHVEDSDSSADSSELSISEAEESPAVKAQKNFWLNKTQ
jgi:hypothetical protein